MLRGASKQRAGTGQGGSTLVADDTESSTSRADTWENLPTRQDDLFPSWGDWRGSGMGGYISTA